jgi:hypothetical protein
MRALVEYRGRRHARRLQRWTEVSPEDDLAHRAGIVATIAVVFMLTLFVAIIVGVVLALA